MARLTELETAGVDTRPADRPTAATGTPDGFTPEERAMKERAREHKTSGRRGGRKVVCFFQAAHKFRSRYATLGFDDSAHLDDGDMWPTAFALRG